MARTLLVLICLSTPVFAAGYEFRLDGQTVEPTVVSLDGTPESPADGDLICVSGHWMVLGPPGDYRLEEKGKRLFRTVGGKEPWVVSLDDHRLLAGMEPEEVRRLRGVWIRSSQHLRLEQFAHLEGPRVCVSMGAPGRPPLPMDLRYLRLPYWSMRNVDGRRWLNGFPDLRVLMISAWSNLPPSKLPRALELRVLRAPKMEAGDYGMLRSYPKLRELALPGAEGLTTIDFVGFFPHLVRLDISRTTVSSLEPLKDHPAIREVDASLTNVTVLPPGLLPGLRRLDVHRARAVRRGEVLLSNPAPPIAAEVVTEFRKRHPDCVVRWRWGIAPASAFAGVDRLVRLNGGSFRPSAEKGKRRFTCSDPDEIRALFAGLAIRDERSGAVCFCSGQHLMELYREEKLLARVSIQHGFALRWMDGEWDGDAHLTPESCRHLWKWLAEHGVDDLLKEAEAKPK